MKNAFLFCCAILLSFFLHDSLKAQNDFTPHTIALGGLNYPSGGDAADFDGDGLTDIFVSTKNGYQINDTGNSTTHIAWYKNLGNGEYEKRPIPLEKTRDAFVADFDNDGDPDIVYIKEIHRRNIFSDLRDNRAIAGILKNDGTGHFENTTIFQSLSTEFIADLRVGDFNTDGNLDFMIETRRENYTIEQTGSNTYEAIPTGRFRFSLNAYINRGDGTFIRSYLGGDSDISAAGMYIDVKNGDLNNDGFGDFAVFTIDLLEDLYVLNTRIYNPVDSTYERTVLTDELVAGGLREFHDYDNDGDLDILQFWKQGGIRVLYENDGSGAFSEIEIAEFIDLPFPEPYLYEIDYDGDGDLDQVRAYHSWHENTDAGYVEHVIDSTLIESPTKIIDPDGDGDWDILVVSRTNSIESYHEVLLWENDGAGNYTGRLIDDNNYWLRNIAPGDYDNDGDTDLAVTSWVRGELLIYENDGNQNFTEHRVMNVQSGILDIVSADLDSDGDLDLITSSSYRNELAWWENDGQGDFSKVLIADDLEFTYSINSEDYDADGDYDIVVGASTSGQVLLWTNDGLGSFTGNVISNGDNPGPIVSADFDGDLDIDVIVGYQGNDKEVVLLRNNGSGVFSNESIAENVVANFMELVDMDDDGNIDVISSGTGGAGQLIWFQNDGSTFTPIILGDAGYYGPVTAADYNADGNTAIFYSKSLRVGYEAQDPVGLYYLMDQGGQNFTETIFDSTFFYGRDLATFDLDNDGDLDLLGTSVALGLKWYENLLISNQSILTITDCSDNIEVLTFGNSAPVNWDLPTATTTCDDTDITIVQTQGLPAGSDFPLGSHVIGYDITDECGNITTCSFNITVEQEQIPAQLTLLSCPQNINETTFGNSAPVNWDLPTATTTCNDTDISIVQTQGLPAGSEFPLGSHVIGYDITDECGNIATCSFNITVEQEQTPAELTLLSCPRNINATSSGNVVSLNWDLPTASTTCSDTNISIVQTQGLATGSDFSIGDYLIVYEISDECGNSVICSFTISVEEESEQECPDEFAAFDYLGEIDGHKYFLSTFVQNWETARETARHLGGHLVSIGDQAENDFLLSIINEIVFIGYNDANSEGDFVWDSGLTSTFDNISVQNTENNDFANMNFWNGEWGLDNKWVSRKFIVEIDCDNYQQCSLDAEIRYLQCDDNDTPDEPNDDSFSFELLVQGYGDLTTWSTEINGLNYSGEYYSPLGLEGLPLFAPGQTELISIVENSGGCSTTTTFEVPEPCPNQQNCPISVLGYEFLGEFNGHHYFMSVDKSTWLDAEGQANSNGGYLVVLETESENNWLKDQISEIAFIGFSDNLEEGYISWSNNADFAFSNYADCSFCPPNTEENDFGTINFWDGSWSFDNQWVYRRHILELECSLFQNLNTGQANNRDNPAYPKKFFEAEIFPNPVHHTLNLKIVAEKSGMETFQIYNIQNQLVHELKAETISGENIICFDGLNLIPGFYFLNMANRSHALKFVVCN